MSINEYRIDEIVRSVINEHINNNIISLGNYYKTPGLRELCHAVKDGNQEAILRAGKLLSKFVESNSILIPIPSHYGYATTTKDLCYAIARLTNCTVMDIVKGNRLPKSLYDLKKQCHKCYSENDFNYQLINDIDINRNIYIVDNVVDTGITSKSVNNLFGNKACILTIAKV